MDLTGLAPYLHPHTDYLSFFNPQPFKHRTLRTSVAPNAAPPLILYGSARYQTNSQHETGTQPEATGPDGALRRSVSSRNTPETMAGMEEDGVCDQSALCNELPLEVVDVLIPTPQESETSLVRRHRVPAKRIAAGNHVRAESSHGAVSRSVVVSYAPRCKSAGRVGTLRDSRMRALGCGGLEIHTYYPAVAVSAATWHQGGFTV